MTNPFLSADGAARYAAGRPDVQALFLARVQPFLKGRALGIDVACGTGQCSVALAELVDGVRAFDISPEMLAHARPHSRVQYALAPAETLPLPDHCADVMTAFMAFHWFQRDAFLGEVRRVLKPDGVLALCNSFFAAEMVGRPEFAEVMDRYLERYPMPERDARSFGEAEAQAAGFSFDAQTLSHPVTLNRDQLVAYLLTQSNTITVTDAGRETPDQVAAWLHDALAPLLPDGAVGEFMFGGRLWVLRPLDFPSCP